MALPQPSCGLHGSRDALQRQSTGKVRANKLLLRLRASSRESEPEAAHTTFLKQWLRVMLWEMVQP